MIKNIKRETLPCCGNCKHGIKHEDYNINDKCNRHYDRTCNNPESHEYGLSNYFGHICPHHGFERTAK